MKKCKNCNFENFDGTNYCQKCGKLLKKENHLSLMEGGFLAALSNKGFSLAPVAAIAIDGQGKQIAAHSKRAALVKVVPLEDGDWYCPDCGKRNQRSNRFCCDCGRDFV